MLPFFCILAKKISSKQNRLYAIALDRPIAKVRKQNNTQVHHNELDSLLSFKNLYIPMLCRLEIKNACAISNPHNFIAANML